MPCSCRLPSWALSPGRRRHTLAKAATTRLSLLQKLRTPGLGLRLFRAGTAQSPPALRDGHVLIRAEMLPASRGNLLMSRVPPNEPQDLRGGSEDEPRDERTITLGSSVQNSLRYWLLKPTKHPEVI